MVLAWLMTALSVAHPPAASRAIMSRDPTRVLRVFRMEMSLCKYDKHFTTAAAMRATAQVRRDNASTADLVDTRESQRVCRFPALIVAIVAAAMLTATTPLTAITPAPTSPGQRHCVSAAVPGPST